jgi:hypothetical protein
LFLSSHMKKMFGIASVVLLMTTLSSARTSKKDRSRRTSSTAAHSHSLSSHSAVSRTSSGKSRHHSGSRQKPADVSPTETSKSTVSHRGEASASPVASVPRPHGQQIIGTDRAREIQEALIREKYLDGEASGVWDARTRQAMVRFQNDNGWQTRSVPDSRALIKLGLGPKHANLINPESVSDSMPRSARELRPGGAALQP